MMDIQGIGNLISSVGFPIVACWYMANMQQKTTQGMQQQASEFRVTIDKLVEALNALTINQQEGFTKILERIGR